MYDRNKVLTGIIVFLVFITSPFWLNLGRAASVPKPQLPQGDVKCIEDAKYMRENHMQILDDWRKEVIRDGDYVYKSHSGKTHIKSLSTRPDSCLGCHGDKEKFCDRCHVYVGVEPYCFTCHLAPRKEI